MGRSSRKLPISDYVADEIARGSSLDEAMAEVAAQLGQSPAWVRKHCARSKRRNRV